MGFIAIVSSALFAGLFVMLMLGPTEIFTCAHAEKLSNAHTAKTISARRENDEDVSMRLAFAPLRTTVNTRATLSTK
jgi:hypothetical protein